MRRINVLLLLLPFFAGAQVREINKLTLQKAYTEKEIAGPLKSLVNQSNKESYFHDDFFNGQLKKFMKDKHLTEKDRVHLYYLMLKKIGYAFVGVEYIPPALNYYSYHAGKVEVFVKTRTALKDLDYDVTGLCALVDSNRTKDIILSSNAILLATILNPAKMGARLENWSKPEIVNSAVNPAIFHHYVCLATSLVQTPAIVRNLQTCLANCKSEAMMEDVFCALYSKNNPVSIIKEYILKEHNQHNELVIQTALCALHLKVPEASFRQSVLELIKSSKDEWKTKMFQAILDGKIPHNYAMSHAENVVTKSWEGVQVSNYLEGNLIITKGVIEFDPY
jgi:hypothetical protein